VRPEEDALDALKSLGINPIYLLSYLINFVVLVVLLRVLLYRPILNMFEERRAKIEKGLQDARAAEDLRSKVEADQQRILGEARAEAQRLRAEAALQAEEAAMKIRTEAQTEASNIKANALAGLAAERDKMLGELRGQIAALAIAAANKLIGETLDRQRQEAIIADFFAKVPDEVRRHLVNATGGAEVTSAVPLTPQEQTCVKEELGLAQASFRVDPQVLGGLRVRVGDKIVDGSVATQLETLHNSLS
jgi:F-type H+-transporting ATPase subunit b